MGRTKWTPLPAEQPARTHDPIQRNGGCHEMDARFALTDELLAAQAVRGTLLVTMTNKEQALFALNWARQIRSLGLRSLSSAWRSG